MKIAILGWGSLIWDRRPEFDDQHGEWCFDGPKLKLEFSRISKTRGGALTLVIDDENGSPCRVAYALSKRRNPDDTICDLRSREGTILSRIGYYFADGSRQCEPHTPNTVIEWAAKKGLDVVVWTGLSSNFEKETSNPFCIGGAKTYLQGLTPEGKSEAAKYINNAPAFVDTPLRRAFQDECWIPEN
ncbi:MAG: hypothetical protein ACK4E3_05960 [Brevundimonas sp.]|uniref:hypothetical protein n=1 Tax=Brevundimonas sp. TaxID=1871086 RepID=UPI00391D154D